MQCVAALCSATLAPRHCYSSWPGASRQWLTRHAAPASAAPLPLCACVCLQVAAVSRRILALQQLLGGGDIDVVWMLVREPRLLSADFRRYANTAAVMALL